ncbi:orotate phosphoribosyltransferase [Candidatus Aciduliprofundum boonei]|uniref:Orotate phosphoribosyltransferase n=1 Tax=Aciduliprofundum boonei (strain DSM 19572 / T469) TaxID=439481 RepID=D3TA50_ACIB4|nr:orotate phosphoribosyltransferase [Candidatus Aciduliprofundum boonei]ADD08979.1 orotate phosphoribosyltransferase [Aciduliprofundum boonei T469]HII55191.1 orotate phosphoribosyltransferase [Candidatus Aciduliprofundum boonei]
MLKEKLIECGAIKFGDFTLASGKKSKYYVDIKKASTKYEILELMGNMLAEKVKGDMLAGVELGAVPLVAITAIKAKRDYLIIRKEKKGYGTSKLIEGDYKEGQEVDIIEDVVTTGGSVLRAIKILRSAGLTVNRVICVVDREEGGKENLEKEGVELISLIKARELL